jgi:TonB family protein
VRVRIRVLVPSTNEIGAMAYSVLGHVLIAAAVLWVGAQSATTTPARPVLSVRLAAGQPAPPAAAQPAPKKKAETPKPPPPEPKPEPVEKRPEPKVRRQVDAPKVEPEPKPSDVVASPKDDDTPAPAAPPEPEPAPSPEEGTGEGSEITEGEGDATAAGVTGLETDQPFTADWYVQLLVSRLEAAWSNRPVLPPGSASQTVVVAFTIQKSGAVTDARVVEPSGFAPLNRSALRAVRSLSNLPPLPRSYEQEQLGARFRFRLLPPGWGR